MKNNNAVNLKNGMRILDLVYISIGTVLIALCSWISIPFTIPFTFQTFAVFLVLLLLGGERGTMSIIVYVLMGTAGLPVFSGFAGGPGVIFGNTGGYIIGFIFEGLIYSVLTRLFGKKTHIETAVLLLGLFTCYAFGTAWFHLLYMRTTGPIGLLTVLSWCVFPFIIPDLIKLAIAVIISRRIRPVIK